MAEPQPPEIHDGPSTPPGLLNVTAEDRKAAAALSSLEARDDEGTTTKKDVDTEALGQAMKNLATGGEEPVHKDSAPRKTIKVDSSDVILMVDQLELSKAKATELLKAHEGNIAKALASYVTATS